MAKRDRHTSRLLTASLAVGAVVAFEVLAGPFFVPEEPGNTQATETPTRVPALAPREKPQNSDFAEITARPLFSPTRRPKVADAGPAVAKTEDFDLIGVIIDQEGSTALLQPKPEGKVVRVVEGENVEGWDVRDIKPTEITLRRDDGEDHVITISQKPRKMTSGRIQAIRESQASSEPADHNASGDNAANSNEEKQATPEENGQAKE